MLKSSDDPVATEDWKGLKEIDRAIAENRLTAYTWKKTWADPWGRAAMVTVFTLLTAYVIFVIINDLIL
ncbi:MULTISPECIES: hypothetical protein [Sphingomonadales]|jgi:hypothetical protein|uniref:Uncharacterized protein n=1 Tax=Sphingobium fuliginis (strain ATCC 27551) TaxID=336203 RepID=A0A292ZBC4_SPHSA|nr:MULTISPECIES: hypothetical protein [Sphingomonadales]WDA34541.1 hypothetical protein PO876_13690 [Sphingobium sp. YC-XJ3]GAY20438.1 hypothetical protein SFOMI_0962 [Sphingobium fuliginis]